MLLGVLFPDHTFDVYYNSTYYVLHVFHLWLGAGVGFALFAALTFVFPRLFGRPLNQRLSRVHFWITCLGAIAILSGGFTLSTLHRFEPVARTQSNTLGTLFLLTLVAVLLTLAAQALLVFNLFWSLLKRPKSGS